MKKHIKITWDAKKQKATKKHITWPQAFQKKEMKFSMNKLLETFQ